jgi:hypothetical protein
MKTVLEIGGGRIPYFIRYNIPLEEPTRYICIDVSEKNLNFAKKSLDKHKEAGNSVPEEHSFAVEDAAVFPLPERFADSVVISNTLSAPIHHFWDTKGTKVKIGENERLIDSVKYDGDPFYAERKPIVDKAIRSLKQGGLLQIYTDLIVYGIHSYNKILEELYNDPRLFAKRNTEEEKRINSLNLKKIEKDEHCCCFRAEVLPHCEVYEFVKM